MHKLAVVLAVQACHEKWKNFQPGFNRAAQLRRLTARPSGHVARLAGVFPVYPWSTVLKALDSDWNTFKRPGALEPDGRDMAVEPFRRDRERVAAAVAFKPRGRGGRRGCGRGRGRGGRGGRAVRVARLAPLSESDVSLDSEASDGSGTYDPGVPVASAAATASHGIRARAYAEAAADAAAHPNAPRAKRARKQPAWMKDTAP